MNEGRTGRRWGHKLLLTAMLPALLVLGACYFTQGAQLEPTPISFVETFTPEPTVTSNLPPSETPFQLVAVTSTPDPLAEAQTQVAAAQLAQQQDANNPFAQTATAMALAIGVAESLPVDDAMLQTATAMAFGVILPTTDPLLPAGPTLDPLFMTATAYITGATQTAAAPMTQTAAALFPPVGLTPTLPPFLTPTVPPTGTCTHTVTAGQNLFRISLQYNTTVDALAAANGIVNPALILVGQQLTIPGCGTSGGGGTVLPPAGGGTGVQPGEQVHVVRQGETLFSISLIYNVPATSIATRNNLSNANVIFINQELIIPVS
ncbi:MAG TPA: LysM peptidoglycan-binding domain-containing protein [Candidatus Limnocylindrales bacterium]|nr:LysM peptidoglycan-binding domain-containing protein [Candidatus Limnocylindrales bacterium]